MSFKIKNNLEVQDIRLGRIPQFDEKSKQFPIKQLLENNNAKLINKVWICDEWYDQIAEGSCVAHAIAHELVASPIQQRGITPQLIKNIYCEAQKIDPWQGGACPDNNQPFYEGTSILAGVKIAQKMGFFETYRWAFGIKDLTVGISHFGPAVLGINWYENMSKPNVFGFIKPTGQLQGGHAILAYGVNFINKTIRLRNSWGKKWGRQGDCWITFDDMEKLLKENGEAVFFVNRKLVELT